MALHRLWHVGFPLQREAFIGPGHDAAIEQGHAPVSYYVQGPQQTPRLAATFIIVGDHMGVLANTQARKHTREMFRIRHQAHDRFFDPDDLWIVEEHRARHMRLTIVVGLAEIDDEQIRLAEL